MKRSTLYVIIVVALAVGLVLFRQRTAPKSANQETALPAVLLVADLREADSPSDICGQIIHVVREARSRGVRVTELMPNSDAVLLKTRHVVVAPTVLVLDRDGRELGRFEGFIALALYLAVDSTKQLVSRRAPEHSLFGIAIASASLIVMPILARSKRRIASLLNSVAMKADSRQTDFCTYLSAILLVGLAANWLLGWWWADPVAALIMVPIIAHEGRQALRGKTCSTCHQ